jgi:hypothetical protein
MHESRLLETHSQDGAVQAIEKRRHRIRSIQDRKKWTHMEQQQREESCFMYIYIYIYIYIVYICTYITWTFVAHSITLTTSVPMCIRPLRRRLRTSLEFTSILYVCIYVHIYSSTYCIYVYMYIYIDIQI